MESVYRTSLPLDKCSEKNVQAAETTADSLLQTYDSRDLQELLSMTACSWLFSGGGEHSLHLDTPPGIIRQMSVISEPNIIILAPIDSRLPLDYKVVHQIVRELTVGIYGFNQLPVISLEPNYDQSSTCQLPPAYYDTKVGQVLINIDYTMKTLWHGCYFPREKRVGFSDLWRNRMGVNADGMPQTKDMLAEFLNSGLMDISHNPCYQDIYDEDTDVDPTYDPNSIEEETLFSRHSEDIMIKLSSYLTSVRQHQNLFVFEGTHSLSNVVRLTEEEIDLATYQRLQKKLSGHIRLVRNHLGRNAEVSRDLAYLKLITFLVPLLISLKKTMLIPNLSQMLPPLSEDTLKTEREVPPHIVGPEFACKHFPYKQDQYFHLHGGIEFDVGTPPLNDITEEMEVAFRTLHTEAVNYMHDLLHQDFTYKTDFPIPLSEIEGKSYNVICFELESLYPQHNMVQWWGALHSSIKTLKAKRLPLTDTELHEQFKRTFGHAKTIKCKNVAFGLKAAAERGLCAVFHSLIQMNGSSHLQGHDEKGLFLLHHAAANNKTHIIIQLAAAGVNLNQTRSIRFTKAGKPRDGSHFVGGVGLTPMHLAAQCGSLESVNCLLALGASYKVVDRRGWMPIHFAAFYGQVACIQALCRKDPTLLEIKTSAEYRSSPLLLSATSGSVEALSFLLSIEANWRDEDSRGNNMVHLAALYFHTDVLRLLIQLNLDGLPVWKVLVEMIQSEDSRRLEMALRSLEVLCPNTDSFCEDIMEAGGVPVLVGLLSSGKQVVQCMAAAVLCHISENVKVAEDLVHYGAISVLINLLSSHRSELLSRCAVILADLAGQSDQYQTLIAQLGGVALVVKLLTSDLQHVLVNSIRCISALCTKNPCNQTAVAHAGGIPHLVEFLSLNSVLQEEACLALAELAWDHKENQELICGAGAIAALVQALQERQMSVQVKAAKALESIASHNPAIQQCFLNQSAVKHLLQLLKVFQMDVREQVAASLWTLAGQTLKQQKLMAEQMGNALILEFLLSSSDKLQYIGCQAAIALCRDSRANQDGFCKENGVPPLVRLLRGSQITQKTLLSAIKALGFLCIGVALTANKNCQNIICREMAIPTLLEILSVNENLKVKVQVVQTLACVLLGNQKVQNAFWEKEDFSYEVILELLKAEDKNICLDAGYALSLFVFHSKSQQRIIREMHAISTNTYETFLNSDNEIERAEGAFQIVVLARAITGSDEVALTARGITVLVELLQSQQSTTVITAAQHLASLAHMRAGLIDAIVTMGTVEDLCAHLNSEDEEVRTACASALGYLTFNRQVHRQLLGKCRRVPETYDLLMKNLARDAKISQFFKSEFERQKSIGLPSLSLEINGGPPVARRTNRGRNNWSVGRSQSAGCARETPAGVPHHEKHRARTANPRVRVGQTP